MHRFEKQIRALQKRRKEISKLCQKYSIPIVQAHKYCYHVKEKPKKSAKILKIFVGKQSVETMYLWVSPASHAQLCEFIAKPSRAWKKRLHQSGRANYRGSAEVFLPGAPTQPTNPTNPTTQPSTSSTRPPLNPLFPGCGQLTPPLPHRGFKSLLVCRMGSQATCFFMKMECATVIIYISHLVGNSGVDNSEVSTIKSSHLLMR